MLPRMHIWIIQSLILKSVYSVVHGWMDYSLILNEMCITAAALAWVGNNCKLEESTNGYFYICTIAHKQRNIIFFGAALRGIYGLKSLFFSFSKQILQANSLSAGREWQTLRYSEDVAKHNRNLWSTAASWLTWSNYIWSCGAPVPQLQLSDNLRSVEASFGPLSELFKKKLLVIGLFGYWRLTCKIILCTSSVIWLLGYLVILILAI